MRIQNGWARVEFFPPNFLLVYIYYTEWLSSRRGHRPKFFSSIYIYYYIEWLSSRYAPRPIFLIVYTAISRKVVGKNVHATSPEGNMGYGQYTIFNDCSCRTYFCCFPLALANICPWPLVPFFQISLDNRADKTTHNTFRDCRVHFFRQPFSKQLYIYIYKYWK